MGQHSDRAIIQSRDVCTSLKGGSPKHQHHANTGVMCLMGSWRPWKLKKNNYFKTNIYFKIANLLLEFKIKAAYNVYQFSRFILSSDGQTISIFHQTP